MENFRCVIVSIPRFRFSSSSFEERTRFGKILGESLIYYWKKREREKIEAGHAFCFPFLPHVDDHMLRASNLHEKNVHVRYLQITLLIHQSLF